MIMRYFNILLCVVVALIALPQSSYSSDSTRVVDSTATVDSAATTLIVYYLHGNTRCVTCRKLEAYSQEAVETGFAQQLKDSTIVWKVLNFDEEEHSHLLKDYGLFGQALILSRVRDGKEIVWRNLDKIWQLVGDKDKFLAYVQSETKAFLVEQVK